MTHGYTEMTLGDGILVAPFVRYAVLAFLAFLLIRPVLGRIPLERVFANPPMVEVCLYALLVAVLIVLV